MATAAENLRGAALMAGAMAGFTINDTFMKALSGHLPLFEAIFLRGILTTVAMVAITYALGAWSLKIPRQDVKLMVLRSAMEVVAAYFFLTALVHMPLANATAILQALPLTVSLGGALFLGEALGWRRLAAILVGFCGVLLIVRPGAEGFTGYSLYALAAVVAVTARDLATRRMSRAVPSLMVATFNSFWVMAAFGVAAAFQPWVAPSTEALWLLLGAGGSVLLAYLFSVQAMRQGEIGVVTPFRYTGLLWALVLGWLVFGDWPTALTMAGAAIVVATGLFTLQREARLAKTGAMAHSMPRPAAPPVDSDGDSP